MQYEDQSILPSISTLYAGALGIGGAIAGMRALQTREAAFWDKNPAWKSKVDDFNSRHGFGKTMFGYDYYDKKAGKMSWRKGRIPFQDDIRMYAPRRRVANDLDRSFQKMFGRNIKSGHIWKAPAAGVFGLWMMNSELEATGDLSGLARGAFREVAAQIGGRVGASVGAGLMPSVTKGFSLARGIGVFGGMAAGAMLGFGVLDMVDKMSKTGRAWSIPDLGGNFMDSAGAQTMRQRSLNAIKTSQFNVRAELGHEAMRIVGL